MTLERASELVKNANGDDRYDLFSHFVEVFNLQSQTSLEVFAVLCGFGVARNAQVV